ncbi:hypothetical protein BDZ45DRAFT_674738 [Acephala macrosclerotiorum]|nr:hypothetical protein BDZ45DRAFT_674738 [Acephala macrosclerotiorum]
MRLFYIARILLPTSSLLLSTPTLISIRFYDFFDSTTHPSIYRLFELRSSSIRTLPFYEHSTVHPYHRRYYKRRLPGLVDGL